MSKSIIILSLSEMFLFGWVSWLIYKYESNIVVVYLMLIIAGNVLRVGDVALCCACGKAILLTRCYAT